MLRQNKRCIVAIAVVMTVALVMQIAPVWAQAYEPFVDLPAPTVFEKKLTKAFFQDPQKLKKSGLEGEIRSLLLSIEKKRFQGLKTTLEINEIIEQASMLYHRLQLVRKET